MRAATGTLADLTEALNLALLELTAPITPATGTLASATSQLNALMAWSRISLPVASGTLVNATLMYNTFVVAYPLIYASLDPAAFVMTNAAGDGTGYSRVVSGKVAEIRYTKIDFANGSTITVTNETTGETIWTEAAVNATTTRTPRQATHTIAGAAALYAALGVAVLDEIVIAHDRIKVVVSSGGDSKTGIFYFVMDHGTSFLL